VRPGSSTRRLFPTSIRANQLRRIRSSPRLTTIRLAECRAAEASVHRIPARTHTAECTAIPAAAGRLAAGDLAVSAAAVRTVAWEAATGSRNHPTTGDTGKSKSMNAFDRHQRGCMDQRLLGFRLPRLPRDPRGYGHYSSSSRNRARTL